MTENLITIQVNGCVRKVDSGSTIADLLQTMGQNPLYLAVEQNRELIRRSEHAQSLLQPDDLIEIVTLVGGG